MKAWFAAAELAGLPGLPASVRGINLRAAREQWTSRPRAGRGGGFEYHADGLPAAARAELAARALAPAARPAPTVAAAGAGALALLRGPAGDKAEARAEIVEKFTAYHAAVRGAAADAALDFAARYNRGEIGVAEATRRLIPTTSGPTVRRWCRARRKDGLAGLADAFGRHRKGSGRIDGDDAVRALIVGMIADRPHTSSKHVMRALRARFDAGRVPAYRTVQRFIERWKRDNADVYLAHTNPDAWKGRRRVAFGTAAGAVERLNQVWEMDATPADVMCADGRHAIVGVVDVFSRRAMVLVTRTSRTGAILALMRRAIIAWGVPEVVKTDQGKDFTSAWMRRALASLAIRHEMCPPFTPEGKPHIERFFGTMARGILAMLPGFIGHDVAGRKAIESRRSFAERMGGAETFSCDMTAEDLQRACDRWLEAVYHRERHGALGGATPFQAAATWGGALARVENERALDVLLAEAPGTDGIRTVGKKGLAVEGTWFIAPELAAHAGRRVHVRLDPADMGRVYVFDADTSAFLCAAVDPARAGVDRRAIAAEALSRQKAIVSEGRRQLRAAARAIKPHRIVDDILRHGESDAGRIAAFPRAGLAHETPDIAAALDAVTPKSPATLTDDDRAAADALFAELGGGEAGESTGGAVPAAARDSTDGGVPAAARDSTDGGVPAAARDSTDGGIPAAARVVNFPLRDSPADVRPDFDDDADYARWVIDNPGRATPADHRRVAELLNRPSIRLLLDIGEADAAALIAAHR